MNKINYDERKITYIAAILKWGVAAQVDMVIEEMAELTKEICKMKRSLGTQESLADEIADVTIMLEQLRLITGTNDAVCEHMDRKIERLRERVWGSEQRN